MHGPEKMTERLGTMGARCGLLPQRLTALHHTHDRLMSRMALQ
jgi:hypothetical protein